MVLDILYIGPCKPAWVWYTVYRSRASLFGRDILYIGPCKPARGWYTVYRSHASLLEADLR